MNKRTFALCTLTLLTMGFCQDTLARDALGNEIAATDPTACAWCSLGAIVRVSEDNHESYGEVVYTLSKETWAGMDKYLADTFGYNLGTSQYNDSHTREEVLAAWKGYINSIPA